jgi:hypothetical protein
MSTNRHRKGKKADRHCGDICAIDPIGEPFCKVFAVEVKRGYSKHTLQDLLDKPEKAAQQEWEKWIEQASWAQSRAGALSFLLIIKRDKRESLVMLLESRGRQLAALSSENGNPDLLPWADLHLSCRSKRPNGWVFHHLSVYLFKDFLETVTPDMIRVLAGR